MNKWFIWVGAVVAGVAIGVIVATMLVEKTSYFCPACGRSLAVGKDFAICKSCGASYNLK